MSRIAILTFGGPYGHAAVVACALERVVPDAILIVGEPERPLGSRVRALAARTPRELAASVARGVTAKLAPEANQFVGFAREVRSVGALNAQPMLDALRDIRPDYLFLAGSGILSPEALSIPSMGTVNVHPGLLPWARGVGVVERAIERRVPVGVTAHFVDARIDVGAIIRRELVWVSPEDTLTSLRRKAEERCRRVIANLVAAAVAGASFRGKSQSVILPSCTLPSDKERRRIENDVGSGVARRLYEEWSERYGDVLPSDVDEKDYPLSTAR